MKESYWKRGSKEDAERIKEAFIDAGCHVMFVDCDQENLLYVFDSELDVMCTIPYDSVLAKAVMDSHMFCELELKVDPIFKVGDRIQHRNCVVHTIKQVDWEKQQYIVKNEFVDIMTIPFREQSQYEAVNIPDPKLELGDLVVLDDLLGRITDSKYEDGMWLYCVGCRNTWNFDYGLKKAGPFDTKEILGIDTSLNALIEGQKANMKGGEK